MSRPLAIEVDVHAGSGADRRVVISLTGEIDLTVVEPLRDALAETAIPHPAAAVLDLTRVTFADSSLIHALELLHGTFDDISITGASGQLCALLSMCGIEQLCR
jgi:anti-anti-sigma factor